MKFLANLLKDHKSSGAKLPPLKLRTFAGDVADFSHFWANFYNIVDCRANYSVEDKKSYLLGQMVTGSEAAEATAGLLDTPYDDIVDFLKTKYGNKRLLLSTLIRDMLFLPQANNIAQAGKALDYLHGKLRMMKAHQLTFGDGASNVLLLSIFESKLPTELTKLWELHIAQLEADNPPPKPARIEPAAPLNQTFKVEQFLTFCTQTLRAMNAASHIHMDGARVNASGHGGGSKDKKKPPQQPQQQQQHQKITPQQMKQATIAALTAGILANPATATATATAYSKAKSAKAAKPAAKKPPAAAAAAAPAPPAHRAAPAAGQPRQEKERYTFYATPNCLWCGQGHEWRSCAQMSKTPLREKWVRLRERMKTEQFCLVCFAADHKAPACQKSCGIAGCTKRHHKMLHNPDAP